jgi:hypothetical protein
LLTTNRLTGELIRKIKRGSNRFEPFTGGCELGARNACRPLFFLSFCERAYRGSRNLNVAQLARRKSRLLGLGAIRISGIKE